MMPGYFIVYAGTPHFGSVQTFQATLNVRPSECPSDVKVQLCMQREASDGGSPSGRMRGAVGIGRDGHLVCFLFDVIPTYILRARSGHRSQSNSISRWITFRLNDLNCFSIDQALVNQMANIFHGPFLTPLVGGLENLTV